MRSYAAFLVMCALSIPASAEPRDYATEVKALYRIGACGTDEPVADTLPKKAIAAHCRGMASLYASYKKAWPDKAGAFIKDLC